MAYSAKMKFIDDRSKLIVAGYIHLIEPLLTISAIIIPDEIISICLIYYFIFESFHETLHAQNILLKPNCDGMENMVLTNNYEFNWGMAYGDFIVNTSENRQCIFEWVLNLRSKAKEVAVGIGIIESCDEIESNLEEYAFGRRRKYANYGWHMVYMGGSSTIRKIAKDDDGVSEERIQRSNNKFVRNDGKEGNKVMVQFDTKCKTLKCWINDEDSGVNHEQVDIARTYRFAVAVYFESARVEIVEFNIKS